MKKLLATTAIIFALGSAGAYANQGDEHKGPPPFVKEALAKLPQDKAEMVMATLKQMHEGGKKDRTRIKAAHEELKSILTAPSFDEKAFLAKTREVDALMAAKHEQRHQAIAELANKLTQDERKVLADILPGGGKFRHHGPHGKGMPPIEPPAPEEQ